MEESKESVAGPEEAAQVEHMASAQRMPAVTRPPNIEQLAKLAAGIVLLLYVTGLLAVNGYLFQLGASDFTLIRPRFVYTGSLIWGLLLSRTWS